MKKLLLIVLLFASCQTEKKTPDKIYFKAFYLENGIEKDTIISTTSEWNPITIIKDLHKTDQYRHYSRIELIPDTLLNLQKEKP